MLLTTSYKGIMEKNGMENAKTEEKKSWFQKTKDTFREHWKGIAVGVAAVGVLVGYIVLNTESEPDRKSVV